MKAQNNFMTQLHRISQPLLCLLLLGTVCLFFTGCKRNAEPISRTGFYFDTVIQITLYDTEDTTVLDGCFELAETYEQLFSATVEGSDVWNINHSGGKDVIVSAETVSILETVIDYAVMTDGALDPTIRPVSELWSFGSEDNPEVPSEADIKEALSHVSYQNIRLDRANTPDMSQSGQNTISLSDADAAIDLGAVAKGYIADQMKEYLLSRNVHSACISLGGNVLVIGEKPDQSPFRIGIQKPFAPEGTSLGTVEIRDTSMVTSGIYERCFYEKDVFYHHILDTATGYPVDNELAAVTILCPSSTKADILSTACMCLGLSEGRHFLEGFPDTEYMLITKDGTKYCSDGFSIQ